MRIIELIKLNIKPKLTFFKKNNFLTIINFGYYTAVFHIQTLEGVYNAAGGSEEE